MAVVYIDCPCGEKFTESGKHEDIVECPSCSGLFMVYQLNHWEKPCIALSVDGVDEEFLLESIDIRKDAYK